MGFGLLLRAIAFVTIPGIPPLEFFGGAGILLIAVQTFRVRPAASGRVVLASFRGGFADIAVFGN